MSDTEEIIVETVYAPLLAEYPEDRVSSGKYNILKYIFVFSISVIFLFCDVFILFFIAYKTYYYVLDFVDMYDMIIMMYGSICITIILTEILLFYIFVRYIYLCIDDVINRNFYTALFCVMGIMPLLMIIILTFIGIIQLVARV